jgi:ssDNA-binding Zn-finger/Zn-ribbon topoisomerase 1
MSLTRVISRLPDVPNQANAALLLEMHDYMHRTGASERHIKNHVYQNLLFAMHLGGKSYFDVSKQSEILAFLDTKRKSKDIDPDEKWKTTYNDYQDSIKFFFRWLYNQRGRDDLTDSNSWETPAFAKMQHMKATRKSPYADAEKWDKGEILSILRYCTHPRNKAALGLFWDLDARNHEVTVLKIKHIRLNERYAEGEIPHNTKTGGGPILLTLSFPYVRDWLNLHPFKDNPDARVICSLKNGAPVNPESMWQMMQSLRGRISRLLKKGEITDPKERETLEHLLRTKKWNPYCIRHSAITYDSDSLPEFALRKKVRWTMNSRQPGRYVSSRMGNNLKLQILAREGIIVEGAKDKPSILNCPKCNRVNAPDVKYCTNPQCSYPLTVAAYEEIKAKEKEKEDKLDMIYKVLYEKGLLDRS